MTIIAADKAHLDNGFASGRPSSGGHRVVAAGQNLTQASLAHFTWARTAFKSGTAMIKQHDIETEAATQVTIITVCYNSSHILSRMLNSIPAATAVILVDNASADRSESRKLATRTNTRLVELDQNIGFGQACNIGADFAETEFLLFLNPDVSLRPGALTAFVKAAHDNPGVVAMNPTIYRGNGRPYFKRGSVLLPKQQWLPRGRPGKDGHMPILTGSALFVRRRNFIDIGGFDSRIFLYHEDDDLALRLAQHGTLMFVGAAVVDHIGGSSTEAAPSVAALKGWHMGRSRVYAGRKHGVPAPFLRAFILASLQMMSPVILFSRRKRAKQWAFLRGVWSMKNTRWGS